MTYGVGEVWRGLVPYHDDPKEAKLRPVVVVGYRLDEGDDQDRVVLVVPVFSYGGDLTKAKIGGGDVLINDYQKYGLNRPSVARARRVWATDAGRLQHGPRGPLPASIMTKIFNEVSGLFPG